MFNHKNPFKDLKEHKILHKKGKQWIVIGLSALLMLTGSVATASASHVQHVQPIMVQRQAKPKAARHATKKPVQPGTMQKQAKAMHARLVARAASHKNIRKQNVRKIAHLKNVKRANHRRNLRKINVRKLNHRKNKVAVRMGAHKRNLHSVHQAWLRRGVKKFHSKRAMNAYLKRMKRHMSKRAFRKNIAVRGNRMVIKSATPYTVGAKYMHAQDGQVGKTTYDYQHGDYGVSDLEPWGYKTGKYYIYKISSESSDDVKKYNNDTEIDNSSSEDKIVPNILLGITTPSLSDTSDVGFNLNPLGNAIQLHEVSENGTPLETKWFGLFSGTYANLSDGYSNGGYSTNIWAPLNDPQTAVADKNVNQEKKLVSTQVATQGMNSERCPSGYHLAK